MKAETPQGGNNVNTIKEKTPFQINEFAAADKLAAEMEQFGLEVDRTGFSGNYPNGTRDLFAVSVRTKSYPVAGNKKLIEALEARGYYVQKCMGISKPRHFKFWVSKVYLISTTQVSEPVAR